MTTQPSDPYNPYGAYQSPNNPQPQWPAPSPAPGNGVYNSPDQNAPTEPFDLPDQYPPPYAPAGPQYPGGRPPQWPNANAVPPTAVAPAAPAAPGRTARVTQRVAPPQQYTDLSGASGYTGVRNARPVYGAPAAAPPQGRYQPAPGRRGRSLPHLPAAHLLLILGVGALALALTQPWGVNSQGATVYIATFNSATFTQFGVNLGPAAIQTATDIVVAIAVLGAALILINLVTLLINKLLGFIGLSGLASFIFVPLLLIIAALQLLALVGAAGFGGFDTLSQLPIIRDNGIAGVDVAQHLQGFYLWWGGVITTFIGTLGQIALRRR